ncbi:MAG: DinB family protein [Leptolyngbya sp.]|nr:DinB family protein [Candidatus Melainabacteria bacterium]
MTNEPKLAKPGAGLPFIEMAIAKHILFPRWFATLSDEDACIAYTEESEKIVKLAQPLSFTQLSERRLIPRLRGLEDSSRYWSIAMTLQHLIIVGDLMRETISDLANGKTGMALVGTGDVKPEAAAEPSTIVNKFRDMSEYFVHETSLINTAACQSAKHPHPWFGPLNPHEWLVVASRHQAIHRKQVEGIIARL